MSSDGHLPESTRAALEERLRELVRRRARELGADDPVELPEVGREPVPRDAPRWFPVPGMYGGFAWWTEGDALVVESWSRVVGGSGQRHRLTVAGAELVESGFV